ncbi:SIR2 family protein [uncultured Alistipes sp.]|uniref:SIR2 family protein n=1 Tax=uncultured Alistipes sp. TaxID=538949 RepID=UPI002618E778|nr:SIR2 family protein [uncultured Alistipes sp.]
MKEALLKILKAKKSSPFLFIGSGFSRRYIGLHTWNDLLAMLCKDLKKPYEYYHSTANGDLPCTASLIAKDYHQAFWEYESFEYLRAKYQKRIKSTTSALKISIANYLQNLNGNWLIDNEYAEEIKLLNNLNVDGIITTNWDTLLEQLLPDYKVYIGQDELLFCNPQSIGEIYKIHGCASSPESMILTQEDYESYNSKNAYLAAKLITIFIEHPIIFIGYSLADSNVRAILGSIVKCLGKDKIGDLQDNLIFVQRLKSGEKEAVASSIMVIDDFQLPITIVKTNNFAEVYGAINAVERKIPTRILRYCKEQIFELVKSEKPEKKLCVVDYENIEETSDIEFVVGLGVIDKHTSKIGYRGIKTKDLYEDLLFANKKFNATTILTETIPQLTGYLPVYKYLRSLGIDSQQKYNASGFNINDHIRTQESFGTRQYRKSYLTNCLGQKYSIKQIVELFPAATAMAYIPFCTINADDLPIIEQFLKDKFKECWHPNYKYRTYYRKLACLYDFMKNGWS